MGVGSLILDLLFPPKCPLCRKVLPPGQHRLCHSCQDATVSQHTQIEGTFFSQCLICLSYQGKVRKAVHRFKFEDQPGYATAFGGLIAQAVARKYADNYDLVTWIPVSAKRLRERGYDQAMLLAQATAHCLGTEAVKTLEKNTDNPRQSSIQDPALRKANVRDVYCAVDTQRIQGKGILLIDDVITTGATMDEAARTLLEAGAGYVVGAALARPPKKHTKEELL